jgi:hypothetical protein
MAPGVVEFVSVVSTQGTCNEGEDVVTCELGDMRENQSAVVTIVTVNVSDISLSDELRNTVTVFSGPTKFPESQALVDLPFVTLPSLLMILTALSVGVYGRHRRRLLRNS